MPRRDRERDAHHRALALHGEEEYRDTRGDWVPIARLDYVGSAHLHAARAAMLPPRRRKKQAPHVLAKRDRRLAAFVRGLMAEAPLAEDAPSVRFCLSCERVVDFMTHECAGRD